MSPVESSRLWTSADLDIFPLGDGKRYEVIDGELFIHDPTYWWHQGVCGNLLFEFQIWDDEESYGEMVLAPGVIFDSKNTVAPDAVWASRSRLPLILGEDGYLHAAPELIVEVLLPGFAHVRRDREIKRQLYSVRGVREYWIADWQTKRLEVYRRENATLRLVATLFSEDELTSPLLPIFSIPVARLFVE